MLLRRLFFAVNIMAVLSLLMQGSGTSIGRGAAGAILEGRFSILWGDGRQGTGENRMEYLLATRQGEPVKLLVSDELLTRLGGGLMLNQRDVVVQGDWLDGGALMQVEAISLMDNDRNGTQGVYGPQPWVSILCKFSDYPDEPKDYAYFMGMYSAEYPGLDNFWRQNSYQLANLEGSGVFGWYVLPHPRNYYLPGGNLDWWTAAQDCTEAADPYVDFSPYVGINLMFNAVLDCCAWGGTWYACLDGVCKNWRTTWEPPWGYENIGVIAHETGHGFGLPHSLGNCQQGYDNRWDVLSDVWSNGADPVYGTMGQHTISYHKEILGWLDPKQVFTATLGTLETISLEKLAVPQTADYLGAVIPIDGQQSHFYTLEVRQPSADPVDYDKWLPGFAVIIHEVTEGLPEPATVIDKDGDCVTGDAGAMYTVGEQFKDVEHDITVSILSATDTGYVVSINNRFTSMLGVTIAGAGQGNVGETLPFTATVSPANATTPITYTWEASGLEPVIHRGGVQDTIALTWGEVGTKTITVTASNQGGAVVDTHITEIQQILPMVGVSGPEAGKVGEEAAFTATVLPENVTQPITYTWQASGQAIIIHSAGLSDTVSYVWDEPGTPIITITAANIHGATTDTYTLPVRMPPGGIQIDGPVMGFTQSNYIFGAEVAPITTTVPITYIWTIDSGAPITHTGGIIDSLGVSFNTPGMHQVTVTASNPAGMVTETWEIFIFTRIFLPMSMRN